MSIAIEDDPSVYSPTTNEEHAKSFSLPAWLDENGEPVVNSDPLGLRMGGKNDDTPSTGIVPLMNAFRGALVAKDVKEMMQINSSIRSMTNNLLMTRATWMFEHMLDPRGRDLFRECGYPLAISAQMYREMYDRDGIAARVVNILPEECWEQPPEVYEDEDEEKDTKFEAAWKNLEEVYHVNSYMERIDMLSGMGSYGLLLLGIDDGKSMNEPIDGLDPDTGELQAKIPPRKLLYLRAFDESLCHVGRWNTNQQSPRYAQPDMYLIRFLDYSTVPIGQTVTDVITHMVHWSRVVHVADNRKSSETFGVPRMKDVFNRLLDLRKLYGGSAEMLWKGGFPGIGLEVLPELADAEIDQSAVREQMEAYQNSLKRYIAVAGMSIKTLETNVADPKSHIDSQLQAISIAKGIPTRVFLGSEQAVKAGEQDSDAWDTRLQRRKETNLTPNLIRPVVERCVAMGIVPAPEKQFHVHWPEASSPTMKDKAAIATALSAAIAAYLSAGGDQLMSPVDFLVTVLGLDKQTAQQINDNAQEYVLEQQMQQGTAGLPSADDLVNELGMDPDDAQAVLDTIQNWMQQQAQQSQAETSDSNGNGQPYQQSPAAKEEAKGGASGGVAGGIGSSGVTGTPGGVSWRV